MKSVLIPARDPRKPRLGRLRQKLLHHFEQQRNIERLLHQRGDSRGVCERLLIGPRGDDDDRQQRIDRGELLERVPATLHRHVEIEQDDGGSADGVKVLERRVAVERLDHVVTFGPQHAGERGDDRGVIIDEQDFGFDTRLSFGDELRRLSTRRVFRLRRSPASLSLTLLIAALRSPSISLACMSGPAMARWTFTQE